MGKGLNTKSGRMLQMIRHGDNPNEFDPTGARVVCANFDHDYTESYEFENRRRRGVNGGYFNAVTDGMAEGQLEGVLQYNLMDDQVLPFVLAKCAVADDTIVSGGRERVYYWPQYDRADRAFFAVEEGRPGSVLRGGFGIFTSFKFNSKTGKKSSAKATMPFVTQAPATVAEMTGASAQNAKIRLGATNVTGSVTLGIIAGSAAKKNVTLAIGNTKAQIEAAFAAQGFDVDSTGTIAVASGKSQTISGTGNSLTIGGVTVDLTTPESVNTLVGRIKAANAGRSTLTGSGSIAKGTPGVNLATGSTPIFSSEAGYGAPAAFDGDNSTFWKENNGVDPIYIGIDRGAGNAAVPGSYGLVPPSGTASFPTGWVFEGSNDNVTWTTLDTKTGQTLTADTLATFSLSGSTARRYFRLRITANAGGGFLPGLAELQINGVAAPASVNITLSDNVSAGAQSDFDVVGTGYASTAVEAGAAGGQIDIEFLNPPQTRVVATKELGVVGYVLSALQQGGQGIAAAVVEPMPILPGHLRFYHADTLAGLDAPEAFIGKISEAELDMPKLAEPAYFHNNTESGPVTYSAHKEPEDMDIMLSVTLPTDENGDCAGLTTGTQMYVSKDGYWRIKMVCPIAGYEQSIEFYGSVGKNIPLTYNENVEERKFVFNLLENRDLGWNFRWKTRVPA